MEQSGWHIATREEIAAFHQSFIRQSIEREMEERGIPGSIAQQIEACRPFAPDFMEILSKCLDTVTAADQGPTGNSANTA